MEPVDIVRGWLKLKGSVGFEWFSELDSESKKSKSNTDVKDLIAQDVPTWVLQIRKFESLVKIEI